MAIPIIITFVFGDVVGLLLVLLFLLVFVSTNLGLGRGLAVWEKHRVATFYLIVTLGCCYLGGAEAADWALSGRQAHFYYQHYMICDFYTVTIKSYLIFCTLVFLSVTAEYLLGFAYVNKINLIEFPLVICFALFFMLLLVSSFNLFGAYVSLEGVTFSLYVLAGMRYNSQNALEAGMKYFCLGVLSSGFLLFGIALVFIITKTLDFLELRYLFNSINDLPLLLSFALIFIFFGFWFKLSIFPCHA